MNLRKGLLKSCHADEENDKSNQRWKGMKTTSVLKVVSTEEAAQIDHEPVFRCAPTLEDICSFL